MNTYEMKQEARRQRYENRAEAAKDEAENRVDRARKAVEGIPFGQPILVGHHSEKRHRADIARHDRNMQAGVDAYEKSQYYAGKAESVGKGGISSDDPDALDKLREKLADMEAEQERMKAENAAIRKYAKKGPAAQIAALVEIGCSEEDAKTLLRGDFAGRIGHAAYKLTNNNGNMARVRDRIKELESRPTEGADVEEEYDGVTYREDVEQNRVMLLFPGKPDANTREILKSAGFRWAPSNSAWQRQLNNAGKWNAKRVLQQLGKIAE